MKSGYGKDKAFSLPEVLLAAVLLAAVVLGYIMALSVGKSAIILSKERLVMSNLLRRDMETVLGTTYNSVNNLAVSGQSVMVDDGLKNISATRTLNVTNGTNPEYKMIYGRMQWNGGSSGTKALSEEMVMYVTNCSR